MERQAFDDYEPTISKVGKAIDWLADKLSVFNGAELCLSPYPKHPERLATAEMVDGEVYDIPEGVVLGED